MNPRRSQSIITFIMIIIDYTAVLHDVTDRNLLGRSQWVTYGGSGYIVWSDLQLSRHTFNIATARLIMRTEQGVMAFKVCNLLRLRGSKEMVSGMSKKANWRIYINICSEMALLNSSILIILYDLAFTFHVFCLLSCDMSCHIQWLEHRCCI